MITALVLIIVVLLIFIEQNRRKIADLKAQQQRWHTQVVVVKNRRNGVNFFYKNWQRTALQNPEMTAEEFQKQYLGNWFDEKGKTASEVPE
jgi:hypothetical protein